MFGCLKKQDSGFGYGDQHIPMWGFITAHSASAGGASNYEKNMNEFQYSLRMLAELEFPYELRAAGGIKRAAKSLFNRGVTCSIEPHFNSFNGSVSGGEVLALSDDSLSIRYAEMILDQFELTFPNRKNRGVKKIRKGDRGYRNLKDAKSSGMRVALISELFFGDCKKDYMDVGTQAIFWEKTLIHNTENY